MIGGFSMSVWYYNIYFRRIIVAENARHLRYVR